MNKKFKLAILLIAALEVALIIALVLYGRNIAVLNPKGIIAHQQRSLIITALILSLVVVIPVYVMTFVFAWKYRENNTKAKYTPEWDHSRLAETIWWIVPSMLILILSVITWRSSHYLDPFKPIVSNKKSMTIQVVALDWKWLFIYPDQNVATVNYVQFPVNTPINFEITADAPMNSFWIPQLGGQIYAMSGMSTHLHLEASENGTYDGRSANISGRGFAGMNFVAKSSSEQDFDAWVQFIKQSSGSLSSDEYNRLALPSQNNQAAYYASAESNLYDKIVNKFVAGTSAKTIEVQ